MTITPEVQTANLANQLIALTSASADLAAQIDIASAAWTNLGAAALLNAFPTAPLNTTGGLGTADVSPTTSHPIDTRVAVGSEISRAMSANDIASCLTYLQGVSAVTKGTAVSANGAAIQLVAKTR